jgi:hypothetical protein
LLVNHTAELAELAEKTLENSALSAFSAVK